MSKDENEQQHTPESAAQTQASSIAQHYRIVLVDDEPDILAALNRLLKRQYDIVTFEKASDALAYLQNEHVDLIISDMRMPVMDGATFLGQAKEVAPLAIRILLTGYADMESTIRAINEGEIYAYLSKPWNNDDIKLAISKALEFKNVSLERDALVKALEEKNKELGSMNEQLEVRVKQRTQQLQKSQNNLKQALAYQKSIYKQLVTLVSEFIELRIDAQHAGHSLQVAGQARLLAEQLGCESKEITQIYFAALLHEVGVLALSDAVIHDRHHSTMQDAFKQHPIFGAQFLEKISAFRQIAHIIRHQDENFDGTGIPDHLHAHDIPFGSRLLRIVRDYDLILRDSAPGSVTPKQAKEHLKRFSHTLYDEDIVKTFLTMLHKRPKNEHIEVSYCVSSTEVRSGDVITKDLITPQGMVLVTQDTTLTSTMIRRIQSFEKEHQITLCIHI